ncbi:hypothetical protein GCM10010508_12320 [Streptomyces naganishii JCM 4654]|uniref:Uncharacterized protein n=1 Tax=Streptomyces naganishii JCM 4654 TaxID=1306179 RepID=A0A919CU42_9ACTN|nr:hypothetical protein GCM10010508_12320 [Streptomyces naganishii JCM 4654]
MPQLPSTSVQALVVTDTVLPLVLTEMPGPAAAGWAARPHASAAATAATGAERNSG